MSSDSNALLQQFQETVSAFLQTLPPELVNAWCSFDFRESCLYIQIRADHRRTGLLYAAECAITQSEICAARGDVLQKVFDQLRAKLHFAIKGEFVPIP